MFDHATATDIVLIITAISTGIVSVIAAIRATEAKELSKTNGVDIRETRVAVNGQTDKLVATAATNARAEGHAAGFAEGLAIPAPGTLPVALIQPDALGDQEPHG